MPHASRAFLCSRAGLALVGALAAATSSFSLEGAMLTQTHAQERLPVDEQIVFLYYKDLDVADRFFGSTLGLEKTTDRDWVKIFRTVPGSSIGAVKEGRGSLKSARQKPVMVSWVVDDVERWRDRLARRGVKIVRPVHESQDPPMKSFLFEDPTGYTFELIQWLKRPS